MSVTLNAKGTSVPSFTIGKNGVTIYQGLSDPEETYTLKDGDYWLDKATNSLKVWSIVGTEWQAPRIADLHFVGSGIVAAGGQDLTFSIDVDKSVIIDAGNTGPALITSSDNQDLHINPATGGGQYLVLCENRWPAVDGNDGDLLMTDGTGLLYFAPVSTVTSAEVFDYLDTNLTGSNGVTVTKTAGPDTVDVSLSLTATGAATGSVSSGALALTLATVNSDIGSFGSTTAIPVITVNNKGLVTAVTTAPISMAVTGDATGSTSNGSIPLTLATVNSNVGQFAVTTINAKGLVTSATNLTGDATSSGTAVTLATVNSNVGSFGSSTAIPVVTVNEKGLVTAVSTTSVSMAITGDATGTATANSIPLTLATVNSNVGQFAVTTVNAKGLVTAANNLTGDITSSGATTTLATVNSNVGTFGSASLIPIVTVNAKGLVTAVSVATPTFALSATGDATGSASGGTIPLTLATVNSNTGSYGSSSLIPVITVNAKGLITAVSTVSASTGASTSANNTFTGIQTFSGTSSSVAMRILNTTEIVSVVGAAPSSTQTFYAANGDVQYYTTNASVNWTINFAWSSGTSMNTALAVGDSLTVAMLTTQGGTAFYASAFQIDGNAVTPKWQGGTAPAAGNINGIDAYTFTIIKTASATYTVLASQTQFK